MKIRVRKDHLRKAVMWYQDRLMEKYLDAPFTLAIIELMERELEELQRYKQTFESDTAWQVPVKLKVYPETHSVEVLPEDESQLLYIDETGQ